MSNRTEPAAANQGAIVVATDPCLTFEGVAELREHVQAMTGVRFNMLTPCEIRLCIAYTEHVPNDPADRLDQKIRNIAEANQFITANR